VRLAIVQSVSEPLGNKASEMVIWREARMKNICHVEVERCCGSFAVLWHASFVLHCNTLSLICYALFFLHGR